MNHIESIGPTQFFKARINTAKGQASFERNGEFSFPLTVSCELMSSAAQGGGINYVLSPFQLIEAHSFRRPFSPTKQVGSVNEHAFVFSFVICPTKIRPSLTVH